MHNDRGVLLAYIADCLAATLRSDSFSSSKNGMVREYWTIVEDKCSEREALQSMFESHESIY